MPFLEQLQGHLQGQLQSVLDLGGPVVAVLGLVSILTLAMVLIKLWQFRAAGVGRHGAIRFALEDWDQGRTQMARSSLDRSRSYLTPVVRQALESAPSPDLPARLDAEAETCFQRLETGCSPA